MGPFLGKETDLTHRHIGGAKGNNRKAMIVATAPYAMGLNQYMTNTFGMPVLSNFPE